MKLLITGGAGFIGSCLIKHIIQKTSHEVVNLDKLTYAGNLDSLKAIENASRYTFEKQDLCDPASLKRVFNKHQPDHVMHLAAESHVDRSIDGPSEFIQTNIVGTYNLIEVARNYWESLNQEKKGKFRFHHISTDEVYGDLPNDGSLFVEDTPYDPSSPYSASKASSDHLVRAWYRTYGLPVIITNCSNNYGPFQFPEKLIPVVILNALKGKPLPIYGDGKQIRDWLFVQDHVEAMLTVLERGKIGETYNIGGHNEKENIQVVKSICAILEEISPIKPKNITKYEDLITFVKDRPGHDVRYAIDAGKIQRDLDWKPKETFETGIRKTVQWYLDNDLWCQRVLDGSYQGQRLGLGE